MADYLEIARRYVAEIEGNERASLYDINAVNAESPSPEDAKLALEHVVHVAGARVVRHLGEPALQVWPERRGFELNLALRTLRLDKLMLLDRDE